MKIYKITRSYWWPSVFECVKTDATKQDWDELVAAHHNDFKIEPHSNGQEITEVIDDDVDMDGQSYLSYLFTDKDLTEDGIERAAVRDKIDEEMVNRFTASPYTIICETVRTYTVVDGYGNEITKETEKEKIYCLSIEERDGRYYIDSDLSYWDTDIQPMVGQKELYESVKKYLKNREDIIPPRYIIMEAIGKDEPLIIDLT